MNRGPSHWNAKLDENKATMIRRSTERTATLAERFGVGVTQIRRIRAGTVWKTANGQA